MSLTDVIKHLFACPTSFFQSQSKQLSHAVVMFSHNFLFLVHPASPSPTPPHFSFALSRPRKNLQFFAFSGADLMGIVKICRMDMNTVKHAKCDTLI